MGGTPSTHSTVTQTSSPPSIAPESLTGYQSAQDFYNTILQNPPVYPGPILAPPGEGQLSAIDQAYSIFGQGPTPWQVAAGNTLMQGAGGGLFQPPGPVPAPSLPGPIGQPGVPGAVGAPSIPGPIGAPSLPSMPGTPGLSEGPSAPSLSGPIAAPSLYGSVAAPSYTVDSSRIQMPTNPQEAVWSLAQPLMRQFNQEVIPGITARSLFAGQGPTSTREGVAQNEAITNLGQSIATGAVAPIYQMGVQAAIEQARLDEAASAATAATGANIYGTSAAQNIGQNNALTNLFSADVGQRSALNAALTNLYGQQVSGNAAMNQARTNLYGQQIAGQLGLANAATNLFSSEVGQNLGLGQLGSSIFGQEVGQNLGLGQLAGNLYGTSVGQNLGLANAATSLFGTEAQQNQGIGNLGLGAGQLALTSALGTSQFDQELMSTLAGLAGFGGLEQSLNQAPLTAAQQQFGAPTSLQSQAAQALINSTLTGGGSVSGSTIGQQDAGVMGTISQIVGLLGSVAMIASLCWVARAIYGTVTNEWLYARHYIFNVWEGEMAQTVRRLYLQYGPQVAEMVKASPKLREALKPLFDIAVMRGREALGHA